MNWRISRRAAGLMGAALIACLGLLLATGGLAAATGASSCQVTLTPFVSYYYGAVTVAGRPAPMGTVVEALNPRGEVVGCFEMAEEGAYGLMGVYGEDAASSPPIPGMREGETVSFRVAGLPAEPALPPVTWSGDRDVHEVPLGSDAQISVLYLPAVRR